MASGRITGTADNGRYLYIDWSSSISGANTSSFTASLYLMGDLTGIANTGSHFTVAGDRYDITGSFDNWGTGNPLLLKTFTKTITHNSSGQATVAMSGAFIYNGGSWTAVYISGNATLDTIPQAPGQPTNVTTSGEFEYLSTSTLSWGTASGTVTGYKIQYRLWNRRTNVYSDWTDHGTTNSSTRSYSITHSKEATPDAFKMRVCAVNGSYESSYVEGSWLFRNGLRIWNGSSWIRPKNIYVWDGSTWTKGYTYIWNGSAWVEGQ